MKGIFKVAVVAGAQIALLCAAQFACTGLVSAQASASEEAAALFDRAEEARAARRLGEARDLLLQSLELDPVAPTAFNLANVLADVGDYVEAAAVYSRLLAGEYGEIPEDRVAHLRSRKDEVESRVASIRLVVSGEGTSTARVNGDLLRQVEDHAEFEFAVNPGEYRLELAREGGETVSQALGLSSGDRNTVRFDHPPLLDLEGGDVLSSPWFWVVVGVVVAGGVTAGILITDGLVQDPVVDPVLGSVQTLRN